MISWHDWDVWVISSFTKKLSAKGVDISQESIKVQNVKKNIEQRNTNSRVIFQTQTTDFFYTNNALHNHVIYDDHFSVDIGHNGHTD